ncbi:MAG TPA: ATP-binding protein [Anaerolineales bacterium]|nr:ATP-binding protein [Anaerolineales bacterium]HLF03456.1 ATP-binding protein [Anaerolineales bacterium]
MMPVLYLLLGVQGSGKSTWASANAERLNAVRLSSDAIRNELVARGQGAEADNGDRVFAIFNKRLEQLLTEGQNVISDATHARQAWRKDEIAIARRLSAIVFGVWFDVPLSVCRQRNASRKGNVWGEQAVPDKFLLDVVRGFEGPGEGEFEAVWRIGE